MESDNVLIQHMRYNMRNIVGRKTAQYTGNNIFGGKRQPKEGWITTILKI